jgi:hypothetical protein
MAWCPAHHKQRIEEVGIVLVMIDRGEICTPVAAAEGIKAVYVVRVPIPEVLDIGMSFFYRSEDSLLICTILKEAGWRAPRVGPRPNDPADFDIKVLVLAVVRANEPAASFVNVVSITLIENGLKGSPRNGYRNRKLA